MSRYGRKPGIIKKLIIAGLATAALIGGGVYAYKEIQEPKTEELQPEEKVTQSQINAYKSIVEENSHVGSLYRFSEAKNVLFEYTEGSKVLTSYIIRDSVLRKFEVDAVKPLETYEDMAEQLLNAPVSRNSQSWSIVASSTRHQPLYDNPPAGRFRDLKEAGYHFVKLYNLSSGTTDKETGVRYEILGSFGYFFKGDELFFAVSTFALKDYLWLDDFKTCEKKEYQFIELSDIFTHSYNVSVAYEKQLEAQQSTEFSK